MTRHQHLQARARRRKQLESFDVRKIDAICDAPIGTAEAILSLPDDQVAPVVRGTCGKYLSDAICSLSGYKRAPIRRMRSLLHRLSPPGTNYPVAPLPPPTFSEEAMDLADDVIRHMPHLRGHEARELAGRTLALFDKTFSLFPSRAEKQRRILARFVPNYRPPPDISMAQQRDLLIMPPAGHA